MKKYFLLLAVLSGTLYLGCEKKTITTEPNEIAGASPNKPTFYDLLPIVQEPIRAMHLIINDNSDNEEGFVIERKIQGGTYVTVANLPPDAETFNDWGPLGVAETYTYRIKAYNDFGSSDWSERSQTSEKANIVGQTYLYASEDAYIDQSNENSNFNNNYLDIALNELFSHKIALIKFPYSDEIPDYATGIKKAELTLYNYYGPNSCPQTPVSVVEIADEWNESTVTWNDYIFFVSSGIIETRNVNNNNQATKFDLTAFVERWFEGKITNNGLAFMTGEKCETTVLSSENGNSGPLLYVEYYW